RRLRVLAEQPKIPSVRLDEEIGSIANKGKQADQIIERDIHGHSQNDDLRHTKVDRATDQIERESRRHCIAHPWDHSQYWIEADANIENRNPDQIVEHANHSIELLNPSVAEIPDAWCERIAPGD